MRLIDHPSPNHGARAPGKPVDMLILHYTGMRSASAALERMCDETAQVSAHYMIDEDGTIYRLVHERRRAWHAGVSQWRGERDINSRSIGIELVNPGHEFGYRPFPEAQMAALEQLAREIVTHYRIPPLHVLAHSDVAPERKEDPGELFDWQRLAAAGIGAWPAPARQDEGEWTHAELRDLLGRIGYGTDWEDGRGAAWDGTSWDGAAARTLLAFQRHWNPQMLTGKPDLETVRRLRALARVHSALLV